MVKLLIDSASDCQSAQLHDYFIPITISLEGREYRDGLDIDKDTFYSLLTSTKEFPKTSQPAPQHFLDIFEQVKENRDELVYLCLSGTLSGTYQSAQIAKDMAEYDKIYIVDTHSVTHGIHILAMEARNMITAGASGAEIAERCRQLSGKIRIFAGVDTLEYLYRGGRMNRSSAVVGEIANIKPILSINAEGSVVPVAKAIGLQRAIATIVKKLEQLQMDPAYPLWSLVTVEEENAGKLEDALVKAGYPSTGRMQVGSTIGAHVGPGLYGILFVEK